MHYLKTILLLIIIFLTSINTSTFAHTFFHEDFETNTNRWSVVQLYGAENTWAVGSATAHSGNKSAYISNDNGQSASYNHNIETIVSYQVPIDLSLCDEKPVLSFWYKYDGEPLYNKDIGNVFINNQLIEFDEQLDSTLDWKFIEQELPNNFPGKKIVLKFQWKNDSETGQNPGFCIDEIKIEGELISGPVFTSESILNVRVGEEFEHLITTANAESQDVTIDLWSNWMTLTNENPSKGTAIIQGVPHEAYEDKEKTVLLIATTQTNKTTKRLKIRVLKRLFVTNHNDSGDGSLRDALEKSSSLAYPADIIITEPGTITLQSDQLNINHSCFITGPGADKLFISGNHSFRIFEIGQDCQVSISGVCIQNGNSSFPGAIVYSGAGILVPPSSELELHNCIIENNFSSKYGGGIYSTGKLMMKNCILRHNQAQQGGGLFYNTLFDTLVINNCQVFQNTSSTYGAGIFITNTYSATNNSSATYPDLTIENTSIMNNQTDGSGGGIFSQRSILNLKNVFICDNSAVTHGGGIVSSHALLRTTHSTIANNYCTADGGGIYNENNSVIYIRNSIIAQNDSHTSYPNIYGDVFSKGYNIISTLMKASFHSNTIGDIYYDPYDLTDPHPGALELSKSVDPMLLPVKQSDGQTHFYAIDWGSSAIDSGICSDLNNEPIHMDFRGIMRPQNGIPEKPSECDIGAYEASILLKATPTSTALPDQPYAFTITTIPDASLLSITMIGLPDWLTLSDDIDGNVIIHGYPDISSSGFYPMTLIVSNQAEYISRPFILTVPFFYENFENKLHDNWQLPEVSETQNFWMIGNHVSKSGQQSAYISYIGTNTASYLSKSCMSVMSLNADLRFIHSPKLKFYWKCKGDSTDYGSIQIKRINGQIQSINKKFNNNSELWQEELVDLSNVEGEKVQILFVWQNNGYANSAPGFCIDEVQLLGTKTQYPIVDKPVFATTPPVIALPEKTYTHMLMVEDYNDDSITITLKESPEWLQFTSLVSENGHALLTGKPSHKDIGLHPVIIMASDNINDVTLSYMINVPVFFDSFETGFSENWSIINGQHLDNRWTTGHATSKHGNQSAYISYDRGQSAAYQPGADQQILSFHADLSLILNPFIQFWWKCGGIQNRQYGEVTIVFNDNVIPLSQPMEFNFSEFWKQKYIDLSKYSGKIIDIQFIWKNASSGYQNNPPFCVDDIEIGGTISQSPALTGPKEYSVVPGKPLAYTITFADFKSSDLDIKCHHLPDWLTYQQIDKSSIVFKAVTEILPSGFFDFTVTASNGAYQTVEQINILVPVFYENFEQASSINMRTYQQPTKAVNQWHIGSESAFSGDQAAYISSDNGISSGFQLSEISRAYMEIPVDLTYCLDPHLFFQWKTDTAVLYGHGELLIMGEDQPLTIKPFTRSKDWQEYSVYLNQFKGEKIILRYAWINDSVKHQHKEPAFCIDDIKIFSPVSPLPVNDSPIIAHIPDLTTMAGDNFLYTITTFDPTNDALTLTVSGQPEWLQVKQTDDNHLVIFGQPDYSHLKTSTVKVFASDGRHIAEKTFQLKVVWFHDSFERPLHQWTVHKSNDLTATWSVGKFISHHGNASIYISDNNGNTYDYTLETSGKAALTKSFDFTNLNQPELSFWWVGKNGVCDVYIQDMDGQQHLLHSLHDWYANNNDWNHSIIDLKQYQGKKVNLIFIWSYRANAVDRPGFCLDDISISGTISSKPVIYKPILTSPTDLLAPMHSEFNYTVSAYSTNGSVVISLYLAPGWLKIQSSDTNNIVLNGFPDFSDVVLENLQKPVIKLSDPLYDSTIDINIRVPVQIETFENNHYLCQFPSQTIGNQWASGDFVSKNGSRSAYISCDQGRTDKYEKRSAQSDLIFNMDLTHWTEPILSFYWRADVYSNNGFGEVYVRDIDQRSYRISCEKEFSSSTTWRESRLPLSDFSGRPVDIIFHWENNDTSYDEYVNTGFCIDDVALYARYSENPVIEKPVFSSYQGDSVINVDQSFSYTITTWSAENKGITITAQDLPEWLTIAASNDIPNTAVLKGTPSLRDADPYTVTIFADDGMFVTEQRFQITVERQERFLFKDIWPSRPQLWYFDHPEGIAIDDRGYVFIVDAGKNRVVKFSDKGGYITEWGGYGKQSGQFTNPHNIAVDNIGYVYVTDYYRVQKFSDTGEWVLSFGNAECDHPKGIAIGSQQYVYMTSKFFSYKVFKYTLDGQFLDEWLINDYHIENIATDASGNIYIAHAGNVNAIKKYDPNGKFQTQWGQTGLEPGQFNGIKGIVVDHKNHIFVTSGNRIQKFTDNGTFIGECSVFKQDKQKTPSQLAGIAVQANGNFYIADQSDNAIKIYDSAGILQAAWQSSGSAVGEFYHPAGMTKKQDSLWVCDSNNHRIQIIQSETGQITNTWGEYGTTDGSFNHPSDIAFDSQGNIYVVDSGNFRIQKFSSTRTYIRHFGQYGRTKGYFFQPKAIAIDSEDILYVTDYMNHCIQKINSDGNFLAQWKNDQIRYPYDIARLNQNIVISNQGSNEIIVFNKSGNIQYRWGKYGHNNGQFISPAGITVDADGHIYVADQNNSRIQKFTSTGAFLLEFNDTGVLPGQLFMPGHIEIDKDQLFVCEPGLNRIQMFQKVPFLVKQKAIIIAGTTGKSDSIWNEVNYVSQYVKRVLHQKGFASDQIFFMSNNTQSESLMSANFDNYQKALQWASDADYLIVCLVDHGGKENFSINGFDALSASKFSEDLNKWQSDKGKQFFVFYDACKSGSFVDSFNQNKNNRIIITSTNDNQKTYFSSEGLHSFSNYFWSNISSGADIKDAFDIASRQFEEQHPQIDSNNNGIPNENEDLTELPFTNIGNVSKAYESISAFKEITATINSQGIVIINASLLDHMKLTRVWAEIKPPDQNIADSKQINVPSFITCEMNLMDNNIYQGHSDLFFHEGHYQIIVYGLDHTATLVNPTFSGIDIGENVQKKKAALIGGYATDPDEISFMQTNIQLAYNALIAQGYYDEDIRIFSSNAINIANIQTVPLQEVNVLKDWIGETRDVSVYLTGKSKDSFMLTESNCLSYSQLNDALSNCDQSIVIIDSAIEQQYLENLSCENRIIVSSMNDLSQYSFSGFFWNNIQDGFTINKAFESAQSTFTLVNPGQKPIINIPDGGILSKNANIGMGVSYVPGEILTSASIEIIDYILTADITSQEAIFCVFAKISYENQETCNITLEYVNNSFIAEIPAECLVYSGLYEVEITIVFSNGNPYFITREYSHTQGIDAYEPNNSYENATWYDVVLFETQHHNFYEINDEDWIRFEVDEKDIHKISISQLGRENDVRFKLLKGMDELYEINHAGLQSDEKFEKDLDPGTYYLCILPADESIFGIHTQYSLTIGKKSAEHPYISAKIKDFLTNMVINNAEFCASVKGNLSCNDNPLLSVENGDCDNVSAAQINYFEETKMIGVSAWGLEVDLKLWPENKGILILNIKSQGNPVTNASILPMCDQPYTITSDCFGNYTIINIPVDTVFQLNVDYFKPISIQSTLYYKDVLESSQKFQVRTRFIHEKIGLAEAIYLKNYLISEPKSISHCKFSPFEICIDNERTIENFDLNQSDTELFFHNYLMQCKSYRSSFNIYPDIFPDYNDDGIVNLKDLIYVLKVLAMYSEEDLNI